MDTAGPTDWRTSGFYKRVYCARPLARGEYSSNSKVVLTNGLRQKYSETTVYISEEGAECLRGATGDLRSCLVSVTLKSEPK